MTKTLSVGLVGAGSMGGALLKAWLANGVIDIARSVVFDPAPSEDMKSLCATHGLAINPPLGNAAPEFLVLAVKPQMAASVLPAYAGFAKDGVVISVMAGASLASIAGHFGAKPKIIRAMPNLPAMVGVGVTGLFAPDGVSASERSACENLLRAVGEIVWCDCEDEIDLVTAISGSGPAYFFLLVEALADAGVAQGMSREKAMVLARTTAIGAGAVLAADDRAPVDIRSAVTSPGGTTEAALDVFDGDAQALRKLASEAVAAAVARAKVLSGRS